MLYHNIHFAPHLSYEQVEKEKYRWIISLHNDADDSNFLNTPTFNFYFNTEPAVWSHDWQLNARKGLFDASKFLRLRRKHKLLIVGPKLACAALLFSLLLFDYSDLDIVQNYIKQRIEDFTTTQRYFPLTFFESILNPLIQDYCIQ